MSESTERELDYAFVRDLKTVPMRVTFVRLIRATADPDELPKNTYYSEDAHVDVDRDGDVVGMTVFTRPGPPVGELKRLPMLDDEELTELLIAVVARLTVLSEQLKIAESEAVRSALQKRWNIQNSLRTAIVETLGIPYKQVMSEGTNAVE